MVSTGFGPPTPQGRYGLNQASATCPGDTSHPTVESRTDTEPAWNIVVVGTGGYTPNLHKTAVSGPRNTPDATAKPYPVEDTTWNLIAVGTRPTSPVVPTRYPYDEDNRILAVCNGFTATNAERALEMWRNPEAQAAFMEIASYILDPWCVHWYEFLWDFARNVYVWGTEPPAVLMVHPLERQDVRGAGRKMGEYLERLAGQGHLPKFFRTEGWKTFCVGVWVAVCCKTGLDGRDWRMQRLWLSLQRTCIGL